MAEVKLQEVQGRYTVTIPSAIVQAMGWKKSDSLVFTFDRKNGGLNLNRKEGTEEEEFARTLDYDIKE